MYSPVEHANEVINTWLQETQGLPVTLQLTKLGFAVIEALEVAQRQIPNVAGRINCENLTSDEWALLSRLRKIDGWIVPGPEEWAVVAGVLALVDIRRGFSIGPDNVGGDQVVLGTANIRLNEHGRAALEARERGEVYIYGEALTQDEIDALLAEDDDAPNFDFEDEDEDDWNY